jgi:hypothetical protein
MSAKKRNKKKAGNKKAADKAKLASKSKVAKKSRAKNFKKKPVRKTKSSAKKKPPRGKRQVIDTVAFEPKGLGARSGGQSGDLQGLTNREGANSESVDELLEEGNSFEAEVVKGVEDALDADEGEVRTHEIPEDDVPEEYREEK